MPHKDSLLHAALKSASRGKPGSPEREAYNEKRRYRRKASILPVLEASRRHKESLHEFLRRRVA